MPSSLREDIEETLPHGSDAERLPGLPDLHGASGDSADPDDHTSHEEATDKEPTTPPALWRRLGYQVFARSLAGPSIIVHCTPGDTVAFLMTQIQVSTSIPPDYQVITYQGLVLNSTATLTATTSNMARCCPSARVFAAESGAVRLKATTRPLSTGT